MKRLFVPALSLLALTAMTGCGNHSAMPSDKSAPVSQDGQIHNEAQFRAALIGPGTLSLMESQLAESKGTRSKVKEFAQFESSEQNALGTILKELNTPAPAMTEQDRATMRKLENAAQGREFDKAYIQAQIEGHQTLKSITDSYLAHADMNAMAPKEMEARHLAMLSRATITQHIANTREISAMLR